MDSLIQRAAVTPHPWPLTRKGRGEKRLAGLAMALSLAACATAPTSAPVADQSTPCDAACLEGILHQYRAAYLAHDPGQAPFASEVRFTENFVEMPFPEGTWDTVTESFGTPLVLSDPVTGRAAMFTAIMQNDTPGFLAIRLGVENGAITEVEHIVSTRRNLSSPPTPIGEDLAYAHDPVIDQVMPEADRLPRERLIAHGEGYLDTLNQNNGEIRGTSFHPDATRRENGLLFEDILGGFRSGRYFFNDRVRREVALVDERRQIALMRGFIDHKGVLDEYTLTNGEEVRSIYREPHSWGLLEMFKIVDDQIVAVEATFITAPYYSPSPWSDEQGLSLGVYGERD